MLSLESLTIEGLILVLILSGISIVILLLFVKAQRALTSSSKASAESVLLLDLERRKVVELENDLTKIRNSYKALELESNRGGILMATLREKVSFYASENAKLEKQAMVLNGRVEEFRLRAESLEKELEVSKTERGAERSYLEKLKEGIDTQKETFKNEFKVLSEDVLRQRQKEFSESNKEGLKAMLNPMREAFGVFKKRVDEVHTEQSKGQGQIENELKNLRAMNTQLSERAENLTTALRNDKKIIGNWGEIQLERLLENAGLDKNCYRREANHKTTEGANQRPDFIIDLPEGKNLIIDSKVSLNAYVDSVNATSKEEGLKFLKEHTFNIRNHIKGLSDKSYDSLDLLESPDFVFMFMPSEAAYLAAFEEDASTFDFAYDRKIAVVTPNTLLPILRTVSSLWRIETQNKSTLSLAQSAEKVHKKLVTFLERFERIGSQLDTVNKTFAEAKTSLSGRGSLIGLVKDFEEKGVKVTRALPSGGE